LPYGQSVVGLKAWPAMMNDAFGEFAGKMRKAGLGDAAIRAFQNSYENLVAGQTGLIPESTIQPVTELPRLEQIGKQAGNGALLSQAVVVKLNGGLGTGMGLEKAKSLLQLKDGLTFLDFIAKQILYLRKQHASQLRFLLMNSFSTSRDTLEFLRQYPELGEPQTLELMQSAVPKVDARTLKPVSWPANVELEWCPPGHGDLYPSLLGSGWLERLLSAGVKYMFVSNSDNLGASLDLNLLGYFAASDQPFLMEVCERTTSDKKGGHLARRNEKLLLRESAQCPDEDAASFQDIHKHRFSTPIICGCDWTSSRNCSMPRAASSNCRSSRIPRPWTPATKVPQKCFNWRPPWVRRLNASKTRGQ
jgi:UDP-N-acetylglucosamine pyrophosphorylase